MSALYKFLFITICSISLGLLGFAQIPTGYYNGTQGLNSYKLKTKLQQIVAAHTKSWNYGELPTYYEQTDRDVYFENDSSVLDIYSENPSGSDPYNYLYSNNSLISGATNEGEGWNREHIYSQSFFNSNYPMYSDLHFVVPTDARVNQSRSNYPFAKVGSATFTSLNGTKVGPANISGYTNTVTEPIDSFKGDVARMLLYVAVRYEKLLPYFQFTNVRNPFDSLSEKAMKDWYIPLMLQWHQQDPVSQKEIDRNNAVYAIQGNRNPFIDHPEFVNAIWGNLPTDNSIPEQPYQVNIDAVGARFVKISWPLVQDQNVLGFEIYLNGQRFGTSSANEFVLHHLDSATAYNIQVRSYSYKYVKSPFTNTNVTTLATDTFSNDLFVSKLIEGSSNNKALEISNNTGYTVDLRNYAINIRQINQSSGALYWSSNKMQLEGSLKQGKKLVIINPYAQLTCFATDSADIISNANPMQFDGKLALDLSYNSTTIDRLGYSDTAIDYAVNKSLYRNALVKEPSTSFDTTQWTVFPQDYCDSLGNEPEEEITGINFRAKQEHIYRLYPNPISGNRLFIEGTSIEKIQTLQIINTNGKLIAKYANPFRHKKYIELPKACTGLVLVQIDGTVYPLIIAD